MVINGAQTLISGIYFIKRNDVDTIRLQNNFIKKNMTTASDSTASLN